MTQYLIATTAQSQPRGTHLSAGLSRNCPYVGPVTADDGQYRRRTGPQREDHAATPVQLGFLLRGNTRQLQKTARHGPQPLGRDGGRDWFTDVDLAGEVDAGHAGPTDLGPAPADPRHREDQRPWCDKVEQLKYTDKNLSRQHGQHDRVGMKVEWK